MADFTNLVDSLEENLVVEPAALRDQLQVLVERVRRDAHHALVRRTVSRELQRHFEFPLLLVALGVLHVAHDSALLLPDVVVVVDLPQERAEAVGLLVRFDLGAVLHHFVAYLGLDFAAQVGHRIVRHALDVLLEPRLKLRFRLALFAVSNPVFEFILVFVIEHQAESVDHLHLAIVDNLDFEFVGFVVVVDHAAAYPHLLLVILDRRARVSVDAFLHHMRLAVHAHIPVFVRIAVLHDQLSRHVDQPCVNLDSQVLWHVLDRWVHHFVPRTLR